MTATGYELPRLRPEVVLGPALRSGPSVLHNIKDPATGYWYRVGPREYFIMARMDGAHTLEDINQEYAEAYERRLGEDSWKQMFTLLGRRQLLDSIDEGAGLSRLKAEFEAKQVEPGSWLQKRWVLLRPDSLCTTLADRFAFAFRRGFVVPALLLSLALQVFVWTHVPTLVADAAERTWQITVPVSLVLVWLIAALHELAHGATCKHSGGTVTEIGVRWRFPMLAPYCRTDDIVLFHHKGARVATAFAGVFVSMLAMLPVMLLWWLSAGWAPGHSLAAGMLLFGSMGALMPLLPFLQTDGYAMLGHALDMADLRGECLKYWRLRVARRTSQRSTSLQAYPARDGRIYTTYGVISVLFLGSAFGVLMWFWYSSLQRWVGPVPAVLILVAETVIVAGLMTYAARERTRKAAVAGKEVST